MTSNKLDGLLEALKIVAEVSGPMKLEHFNDVTWKMLCTIQARIAEAAAKEASPRD